MRRSLGCLLVACAACAPAQGPRETSPLLTIPSAAATRPGDPQRPEPPAAPADLAGVMRINDPELLVREIGALLPPHVAGAFQAISPAMLLDTFLGPEIGAVVDLTQPVDVASVGHPDPEYVVSLALVPDGEATLARQLTLHEEGGLVFLGKGDDDARRGAARQHRCALAPSTGRATTRLVCGSARRLVKRTAAYLASTVAAEPFAADARVTLPGSALRKKQAGAAKSLGDSAGEKLGEKLGADLVDRFLDEIDRIDASIRFVDGGIDADLDLRLNARRSIFARAIIPTSAPKTPSRAFRRLPADVVFAMHTVGARPEDMAPLRTALAANLDESLTRDGYLPEKARALRDRLEALLLTGGPLVFGAGIVGGRDGAEKALAAFEAAKPGARDLAKLEAQARGAITPWYVFEVEEPTDKWIGGLRDIVRGAEDADKTRKEGSTSTLPRDPDGDHIDVRAATLDPALRLPKDALHLEVLLTPNTKGHGRPRKAHLFVVRGNEKGTATWIGYSEDAAAIASRLRLATDDTTDAGTLGKSAEASSLQGKSAVGAGLVVVPAVSLLVAKDRTSADLRETASSVARWSSSPLTTESVTFTMSADPGAAGGRSRLSVQAHASRTLASGIVRLLSP
ncbi:MAG: hypothetical protein KF819_13590 [Labilithrix sp.]|nr:hypothetical protein [Labilithrix sp.]